MTIPLYIFDLDGTLALIEHRRMWLDAQPPNWPAFYAACDRDLPNTPIIELLQKLYVSGADIWVWSSRSDEVVDKTIDWLEAQGICYDALRMRHATDYTPDDVLKAQWLAEMSSDDRARLAAVFDDRDKVVRMWRAAGVTCLQVVPGAF